MLRSLTSFALAIALLAGSAISAFAEKRVALVIGNAAYKHTTALKNPENDAVAIAQTLERLRFDVVKGLDLSHREFGRTLAKFRKRLVGADVALFFFAGHGLQMRGHNFLLPIDAKLEDEDSLDFEAVRVRTVLNLMERSAPVSLVFLDSCRNNPLSRNLARNMGTRSTLVGRGFAREETGVGSMIVFATQPGNVAEDGAGGLHSPFTEALLSHIQTPGLDIAQLMRRVRVDVMKATSNRQVPWDNSSLTGDFVFNKKPVTRKTTKDDSAPRGRKSDASLELEFWNSVRDSNDPDMLAAYLDRYPDGTFSALARIKHDKLIRQKQAALPPKQPENKHAAKKATGPPIEIAVSGPFGGMFSDFGNQMKAGAEMARKDINKAGGILGRELKVTYEDDNCEPKRAVEVAHRISRRDVKFVAGHFCSGASIPASRIYQVNNILQISPASTSPKLTDQGGWNVFRVSGRDDQQGKFAGAHIARAFSTKRIAIFHDNTSYGKGLADDVRDVLRAKGIREVLFGSYPAGHRSYSKLVSRLQSNRVEVLYIGGYHSEAGLIVREMRRRGMKTQLIAGDALVTPEFWKVAGRAGENTLMTFSPDPRLEPAAAKLVKRFRAKGVEPEGYVLHTYAAIQVWAEAVNRTQKTDAWSLSKAIKREQYDTVLGRLGFDQKGDVTIPSYALFRWSRGTYAQVK